jgi:hypothetical protein
MINTPKSKGKSITVLAWTGPDGPVKLRLSDFMIAST